MQRRKLLRAAAALGPLSVLGSVATAQTQPIKVVVGFAPAAAWTRWRGWWPNRCRAA